LQLYETECLATRWPYG